MSEDANTSVVGSDSDLQPIARRACLSCKKRRRKCTKQIPTCGECKVYEANIETTEEMLIQCLDSNVNANTKIPD